MSNWWCEFERRASLNLEDNDKAHLEELTGCDPILLRPLLYTRSSIAADSQGDACPEGVEYLSEFNGGPGRQEKHRTLRVY